MSQIFAALLVLLSSVAGYLVLRRRVDPSALRPAVHTLLECLGAAAVFLVGNVVLAMVVVMAFRLFTPLLVSPYIINPLLLIILSTVQGFVFYLWWRREDHIDA